MQDDNDRKYFLFAELVILVVKENGALSEADGYYCTYSFGGRLDILWLQSTSTVSYTHLTLPTNREV